MLSRRAGDERNVALEDDSSRLVSTVCKRGFLVARIEKASLTNQLEIGRLKDELLTLLEDADVGLIVDGSCLTQRVSSEFLGVLVGLAKQSRRIEKKFAVCNLSAPVREGFDAANLRVAVNCFDGVTAAVRGLCDLGKSTTSRATPMSERLPLLRWVTENAPDQRLVFASLAVIVGLSAAITTATVFNRSGDRSARFLAEPEDQPFETAILGKVEFALDDKQSPDNNAFVIAWPEVSRRQDKVSAEDVLDRFRVASGALGTERVFVTCTNADGRYRLKVDGRGIETGLNVLVISHHVDRLGDEDPPIELLGRVMANPDRLLKDRRHHLGFVYIRKDEVAEHDVLFDG